MFPCLQTSGASVLWQINLTAFHWSGIFLCTDFRFLPFGLKYAFVLWIVNFFLELWTKSMCAFLRRIKSNYISPTIVDKTLGCSFLPALTLMPKKSGIKIHLKLEYSLSMDRQNPILISRAFLLGNEWVHLLYNCTISLVFPIFSSTYSFLS